jgi:hypothetical protein
MLVQQAVEADDGRIVLAVPGQYSRLDEPYFGVFRSPRTRATQVDQRRIQLALPGKQHSQSEICANVSWILSQNLLVTGASRVVTALGPGLVGFALLAGERVREQSEKCHTSKGDSPCRWARFAWTPARRVLSHL